MGAEFPLDRGQEWKREVVQHSELLTVLVGHVPAQGGEARDRAGVERVLEGEVVS